MSVVIGIKDGNTIWLGADGQTTCGASRETSANKNNLKIWEVKNTKNTLMGAVGRKRESNVIATSDKIIDELKSLKKEVDFTYVVTSVVPNLFNILLNANVIAKKDGEIPTLNNTYLLATNETLFEINFDGCVTEIDDYIVVGSGKEFAMGVLNNTLDKPPKERIVEAIKATTKTHLYVDYPIVICNTDTMEFEIIND